MKFKNERTFFEMTKAKKVELFHRKYEEGVEKVRKGFETHYPNYIGGKESFSSEGEYAVITPINKNQVIGYCQKGTREDAKNAILAAKDKFYEWSRTPYQKRVKIFQKAAKIMSARKFELAALMTFDNGKNRYEAIADVDEAIDFLNFYSYLMLKNKGFIVKMGKPFPEEDCTSVLKPYGVWAVISPFNFPLAITTGMSTGAMITGNTIVLKPASDTPLMALKFYEIMKEAGLPDGVMNLVVGSGSTVGEELISNPDISGVVFTGSRPVGRRIFAQMTSSIVKPCITELGGKNPIIVTSKANLDKAIEGVARSAFGFGGQKCSACSRLIVFEDIKEKFLDGLVKWTREKVTIGDPTRREIFLGPVINQKAYDDFAKYAEMAKRDGRVLFGGNRCESGELKDGFFVEPTIVDGLPLDHEIVKTELFLPIVAVITVKNLEEAVKIANDTEYGLTAGIFTENVKEREYFFDHIEAGVTYCNRRIGGSTGAMVNGQPFGGWKASSSTAKGAGGLYYLQQFMREQSQTRVK
jgi:1-pyrroline-5-carboxylate dehydrogenase